MSGCNAPTWKIPDHYLDLIGLTETAKGDGGESYLSVGSNIITSC